MDEDLVVMLLILFYDLKAYKVHIFSSQAKISCEIN